jgi:SAM-dependent methyltransferase
MPDHIEALTDRGYLTGVQYRTDANLAARQSIYAYQQPRIDLVERVLELAGLTGQETVADVGCGNGLYLAGLARRGHRGRVLGLDLSIGMLRAAGQRAQAAALISADAARLPLADRAAHVALAMHMLYHVPDRQAAVRELRRITRPDGVVLVVLNDDDHQLQLRQLLAGAAADIGLTIDPLYGWGLDAPPAGIRLGGGAELLGTVFSSVQRHDFISELRVPDPQPVLDYVRSMRLSQTSADPDRLVAAVADRLPDGPITITTHCGCLVCR